MGRSGHYSAGKPADLVENDPSQTISAGDSGAIAGSGQTDESDGGKERGPKNVLSGPTLLPTRLLRARLQ